MDDTQQNINAQTLAQSPAVPNQAMNEKNDSETYIANTGGAMITLLKEISENSKFSQRVAEEMGLSVAQCTQLVSTIIKKINQGQITADELAVMMTAPIIDELSF